MKKARHFIVSALLLFISSFPSFASSKITLLPGFGKPQHSEYAGYIPIKHFTHLFYWFVASKSPKAPIIIWTNGGPGYSSLYGFFNEVGPYHITKNLMLTKRKHSWSHLANLLVIDQPGGVGLSDVPGNYIPKNPWQGTQQYYQAIKGFLAKHPRYKNTPILLAGESYAGTYLPLLAEDIIKHNQLTGHKINLKGLILCSPWIDPLTQETSDRAYLYARGLLTPGQNQTMKAITKKCKILYKAGHLQKANQACGNINAQLQKFTGLNMANLSSNMFFPGNNRLKRYLNQLSVRKAIHATESNPYQAWSRSLNKNYIPIIQRSFKNTVQKLLKQKLPILIFTGLEDGKDTNALGIKRLIEKLHFPKKYLFNHAQPTRYLRNNKMPFAYEQKSPLLDWVKVRSAGHMVPEDAPQIDRIISTLTQ